MPMAFAKCALALLFAPTALLAADPAEYAIRWSEGGPTTSEAVIKLLKLTGEREVKKYAVQYFQLGVTPALGPGEVAVGRVRTRTGGKVELTYKTRTDLPPSTVPWICPLEGAKPKTEVDVTLRHNDLGQKLSRSCELEAKQSLVFPESLKATPMGCTNTMTRTQIGHVKVEQWTTPRGPLLEVSMPGTTSDQDLASFRTMVAPLIKAGVKPLDRSKTEAGSEC